MDNASNLKILIIGKSGQLAQQLFACKPENTEMIFAGRSDVDITDISSIQEFVFKHKPSVVINTAAYTAVDNAEVEHEAAFLLNKSAVKNIAEVCHISGCRLIHISTDFVFDGSKSVAYHVDDLPLPLSVYGKSKAAGELEILGYNNANFSIIRTSWLYSKYGNNFLKTMLKVMRLKNEINVVDDQISCPTSAVGLSLFILKVAELEEVQPIYNWSDYGVASWYDFAQAIYEYSLSLGLLEKTVRINPIKSKDYSARATRPAFSLLDQTNSHVIMQGKYWRECVKDVIVSIKYHKDN